MDDRSGISPTFFLGKSSPASPSLYFYRTGAYVEKLQNLVHRHLPSNFLIVLGMPPVRTLKAAAEHCCIRHNKEI